MTKSKVNTIILHCIGWLLFFSLPVIFIISESFDGDSFHLSVNIFTLLSISTYIFIFYFHTYFLFPQLFLNKKRGLYVLSMLALLLVIYFLHPYDNLSNQNRPGRDKLVRMGNRRLLNPIILHPKAAPIDRNLLPEMELARSPAIWILSVLLYSYW